MKRKRKWGWLLVVMLSCFGTMGALVLEPEVCMASEAVTLDMGQLVALSDVIVHGQVVHSESVVFPDDRIMTKHTVRVSRWLKQDAGEVRTEIEFYTRGGVVGDQVTRVTGEVQIRAGEEAVLFLADLGENGRADGAKHYFCVGLSQGAYLVTGDGAEKHVVRSDERIRRRVVRMRAMRASFAQDKAEPGDVTLEAFLTQVAAEVAVGRGRDEVLDALPFRRTKP